MTVSQQAVPVQPQRWAIIAIVLWTVAPICVVYGGWAGLIVMLPAWAYGTRLLRRRRQWLSANAPR
ncbi:hypothetical protein [Actinoplanes sp. G11-F43]|uniref:hypothetical protein n=1 Tax=Actinoplanes sp. G11-F43 TaxID=3424130 RepID=UPI003D34196F